MAADNNLNPGQFPKSSATQNYCHDCGKYGELSKGTPWCPSCYSAARTRTAERHAAQNKRMETV